MEKRTFGKTGLEVTPLGFGAAEIGYEGVSQSECDALLNAVLDLGINLIDTAACYKDSEEKIGPAISHRRDEFVLVSKCGHHVEDSDPPEWSPKIVRISAERSLRRMKTDHLDVLLIHSCPREHLRNYEFVQALQKCKSDGLTRFIGYSGDNEALEEAISLGVFDVLESSINFCDQRVLDAALPPARENDMGVIAKRPIANGCWRDPSEISPFYREYMQPYVERLAAMDFTPDSLGFDGDWAELALRFTVFQDGVHTAIIGGKNMQHIRQNVAAVQQGPLESGIMNDIRQAWSGNATESWVGKT